MFSCPKMHALTPNLFAAVELLALTTWVIGNTIEHDRSSEQLRLHYLSLYPSREPCHLMIERRTPKEFWNRSKRVKNPQRIPKIFQGPRTCHVFTCSILFIKRVEHTYHFISGEEEQLVVGVSETRMDKAPWM